MTTATTISGTVPNRAARWGMRGAVSSMPTPQAAAMTPIRALSTPWRSKARGTSGHEVPASRPAAAQAAKIGSKGLRVGMLLGDTQMPFRAEGRQLVGFDLDLALGLGGRLLLAPPHIGIKTIARQEITMPSALDDAAAVEHHDLVGVDDRRQTMGDHE